MTAADDERLAEIREESEFRDLTQEEVGMILRALDAARAENKRLRQQPAGTEFLRQLEIALDTVRREYDAVRVRAQRAEAGLETSHNVKVAQATVIGQQNLTIAGLSRERDAANAALARVHAVAGELDRRSDNAVKLHRDGSDPIYSGQADAFDIAHSLLLGALYGEPTKEGNDG